MPGPAPVSLPALTGWKFSSETPEAQPGFDDSSWTLADHPVSNASSPSTPVLYASDYGYDHGFVWYRGHFTATGNETGVTLTRGRHRAHRGLLGLAERGVPRLELGGRAQTRPRSASRPGRVRAGQDNVLAVLVENTGNPEGPSGEKVGLYSASYSAARAARRRRSPGG